MKKDLVSNQVLIYIHDVYYHLKNKDEKVEDNYYLFLSTLFTNKEFEFDPSIISETILLLLSKENIINNLNIW